MNGTTNDLPTRVRAARERMGLTQRQFAEKAGVGPRAYQNFETGANRPQPHNLRKILAAAEIDAGDEQREETPAIDGELAYFLNVVELWLSNMEPARRTFVIHELTRRIVSGALSSLGTMPERASRD